jgi:hypothetical protein
MAIDGGVVARLCGRTARVRTAGRWPRWRTRRRRRLVVAALAVTVLFMVVDGQVDVPLAFWLWPVGYLAWVAWWLVLRALTSAVADSSAAVLDERERAIRDRLGYRAFTVLILVNAAVAGFLFTGVRMPHLGAHVGLLLLSLTLGAAAVPTGTLAWTMPDDDPEDLADA